MNLPFVLRSALNDKIEDLNNKHNLLAYLQKDLDAIRRSALGAEQAHAHEVLRLKEQLASAHTLTADKQQHIATLRAQLSEKEFALQAAYTKLREDSQKIMDWMAKGMSHGVPIFAELPPLTETEPAKPEPKPGTERIPTPVEQAIQSVGRKARAIVNHISHRNDTDFADAMAGQGVKRKFQEDKIDAEIEAELIAEQSKTA